MKRVTVGLNTLAIFIGSLLLFYYGLFGRELTGFETRFGLFAKEMLQHGPSLFPTAYHVPYPDYPGLHTFLIYLCSLPLGHVTAATAILPSAVASAACLAVLYLLLVPRDRTWAMASVLLCLLTFQFVDSARSLTMDSLVMFITLLAFYIAFRQDSLLSLPSKRTGLLCIVLALGFAIRGPIGLVLPAGVVFVCHLCRYGFKNAWRLALLMAVLLVALTIILIWMAYGIGGGAFVKQVLQMQFLGRMGDAHHHYQRMAYFSDAFANYALSFELALLTVIVFATKIFKAQSEAFHLLRQCVLWVLVVMVGMSIPGVRKIRYIMPMIPALAILAGYWWCKADTSDMRYRVLTVVNYVLLALPFICIVLVTAFIMVVHMKALDVNAHYFSAYVLLTVLALLSLSILWHHPKAYGLAKPLRVLAIGVASFWVVMVFVIQPVIVSMDRSAPFVEQVLRQLPADQSLFFFKMDPDSEAIQFMLFAPASFTPHFVQNISAKGWYLTDQATFDQQPAALKDQWHVVQTGRLGHRAMVMFNPVPAADD